MVGTVHTQTTSHYLSNTPSVSLICAVSVSGTYGASTLLSAYISQALSGRVPELPGQNTKARGGCARALNAEEPLHCLPCLQRNAQKPLHSSSVGTRVHPFSSDKPAIVQRERKKKPEPRKAYDSDLS